MNALILLFYRIVTFFTRVPTKTRNEHTLFRAQKLSTISTSGTYYINNQSDFHDVPYGTGDLGANGCGPIALFNAIRAIHEDDAKVQELPLSSFTSIVDYLELKGAAFRGHLGTDPHVILRYLNLSGYNAKMLVSKNEEKLDAFSKDFDAYISLIYNDSASIKKGLHFICTKRNIYGSFTTHNPERTGSSLYKALSMCSNYKIRHVCTIGIKK